VEASEDGKRACYAMTLKALVDPTTDPRAVVNEIAEIAWTARDFLLPNCHGLMHTVGREYARDHDVTLATLMDYLPANNDPGCTAGFSHGVVTGIASHIHASEPEAALTACAGAATRFQRYSCIHGFGHAFMRMSDEDLEPTLAMCTKLGPNEAPDCAQGAYHDYWFAVIGADDTTRPADAVTDPRALCTTQPDDFVRPCWYRAFIDTRPAGFQVSTAEELDRLCTGLTGLQRSGCMTAASVIGPPDPVNQLVLCEQLRGDDAVSCIRGAKVQNLLKEPPEAFVDLVGRCAAFPGETATQCYRWLGKVVAVLTDGEFERTGCPQLPTPAAREACIAGARTMDEALVTFS
jgi:hypothetical protein